MKPGPPTDEQEPTEHQGEPVPGLRNEKLIGEDAKPGIRQTYRTQRRNDPADNALLFVHFRSSARGCSSVAPYKGGATLRYSSSPRSTS